MTYCNLMNDINVMTSRCQNCSDSPYFPHTAHTHTPHADVRWEQVSSEIEIESFEKDFRSSKKYGFDANILLSFFCSWSTLLTSARAEQFCQVDSVRIFCFIPGVLIQLFRSFSQTHLTHNYLNLFPQCSSSLTQIHRSTPETWALMWLSMHQHIKTISLSSCFTRFHCLQEESHLSWDTSVILKHCMRKCSTTTKLSLQQMICTESLNTVLTKIMEEEM